MVRFDSIGLNAYAAEHIWFLFMLKVNIERLNLSWLFDRANTNHLRLTTFFIQIHENWNLYILFRKIDKIKKTGHFWKLKFWKKKLMVSVTIANIKNIWKKKKQLTDFFHSWQRCHLSPVIQFVLYAAPWFRYLNNNNSVCGKIKGIMFNQTKLMWLVFYVLCVGYIKKSSIDLVETQLVAISRTRLAIS